MKELNEQIQKLEEENDKLKDLLLDVTMQLNYSKEKELLEFVQTIYLNVNEEIELNEKSKLSKEQILFSVKKNIEKFAKEYKINLT